MNGLIITIFITTTIILGIEIARYIENMLMDVKFIKDNKEEIKILKRRLEKQENETMYYLKETNNLRKEKEELEKEIEKEK